jgi:hypothetical protein
MQVKFNLDIIMGDLYKSKIPDFFAAFNRRLLDIYNINKCLKVYKNGGVDPDR